MPNIRPVSDLRNHFAEITHEVQASKEPVFLTKNGVGSLVVMSMETYEKQLARVDMHAKIAEGKAQADNGELLDGKEELAKLRSKYVG